jgi:hypothetical protein
MLIVLEALRIARSRDVLSILLRIVNLIVGSDPGVLEKIAVRRGTLAKPKSADVADIAARRRLPRRHGFLVEALLSRDPP